MSSLQFKAIIESFFSLNFAKKTTRKPFPNPRFAVRHYLFGYKFHAVVVDAQNNLIVHYEFPEGNVLDINVRFGYTSLDNQLLFGLPRTKVRGLSHSLRLNFAKMG